MSLVMILITTPIQAIALSIDKTEVNNEITIPNHNEIEGDVFIVQEDISKRGQFEKHYLCSDGTYVSVAYPEAIHYLDENSVWQDVDQSLRYDSSIGMYTSDKTDFSVSFSNNVSSTNIAKIEKNGYTLSWGIQTTQKIKNELSRSSIAQNDKAACGTSEMMLIPSSSVAAKVSSPIATKTNMTDRLISSEDTFSLPNISSQISYNDIFDGIENVSLKYTVYHNKIEEDIVISERGDIRSVSMNMDIGILTPIVNADGSVNLVDTNNEMQFHIGIPYMVDADYKVCNDIQVTAEKNGTFCVITYTPNAEWFESSERVFPILLDPSITTNDYVSNIEDTYVEQNSSVNHSSEQYLYITPNGSNKRNAIVRITKLPEIDNSMPIISASLSLTTQSASSDEIDLKASYVDSGLELHEYTYYATTIDTFTYVSHSMIGDGESSVVFDVSPYIYEMYADKQFDDEYGYDYHGDFIIGYDNSSTTTYLPPFYSSEYTITSNRPVFKVRYGYTLPAGMLSGSVYSFRNGGSYSYMSVNGTNPTNNSNIYQVWSDGDIAATTQKFKLEYVQSTGGYLLRAMSSSSGTDKVVSINRSGMDLANNMNVTLSTYSDSISQEWLIIPIDYDEFKIVPRANMSLALTSYGFNDGTNTGITSTSQGNIFVQTMTDDNSNQKWYIFDNNDNEVMTSQSSAPYETGYYYISNSFNGKYLHISNSLADCMRGQKSALGDSTVKWHIFNLGDGYCTIQRTDILHCYLAPSNNTNGSGVRVYNNQSETIPDICKWSIQLGSSGGYVLRNKGTGYYLTATDAVSNPSSLLMSSLYSAGTDAYKRQNWRIVPEDYYVELGVAASFNDIDIDVGETKGASINKAPSSASWASYTDFDYIITSDSQNVSYDANTHKFTSKKRGEYTDIEPIIVSVTATHKTTGLSDTFEIKVNKEAIIIIPGILGSELFAGQDYGYFKEGMPLISTSMQDCFHGLSTITEDFEVWKQVNEEYLTDTSITLAEYADCLYEFLRCNDDGTSNKIVSVKKYKHPDLDNERSVYTDSCGTFDYYDDLYEALIADDDIDDKYYVEFFSYDWRMANTTSAILLNSFISNNNYDKVTLVAHSMGGLVASAFLALGEEQKNKVDELYYIASPLLGTPEMANVLGMLDFSNLSGGAFDALMSNVVNVLLSFVTLTYDPLRSLLCNYQSVYELMPSEYYFSFANKFYMTERNTLDSVTNLNYSQSWSTLAARYCYPFQTTLNNNSRAFHNSLFNSDGTHISENVNAFYLYGVGGYTLNTLESIEMLDLTTASYNYTLVKNTFTLDGDSMVPKWSAALNGAPNSNRIYKCSNPKAGHTSILWDADVLDFITENIQGEYVYSATNYFTRGYN